MSHFDPAQSPQIPPESSLEECPRCTYVRTLYFVGDAWSMALQEDEQRSILHPHRRLYHLEVRGHACSHRLQHGQEECA